MQNPTPEQAAAAEAFHAGEHLTLQAGAGTGKTTTLAYLAHGTGRRGRYLAYNKTIVRDAAARFPRTVQCSTAHALAYAALGHRYRTRLNSPRQPGWKTGHALGITKPVHFGERDLSPRAQSYATLRTVSRFCHSADPALAPHHVPRLRGLEAPDLRSQLALTILPFARKAWADLQTYDQGVVRFEHDHYLKIWALTNPKINTDFLLLDEAQDTNPVVEQIYTAQRAHAQLVMVGDSAQAIYQWRGAKDVMTGFNGTSLHLSKSFRFGPRLATEANRWLTIASAPLRLTGSESISTDLAPVRDPDAVLCRTNVGAMAAVMELLEEGRRVALVGGGGSLRALALAAGDLKAGRRTAHPELILFTTWGDLQDYAERDPAGGDLMPLVNLVDKHGTPTILTALDQLADETRAEVTVSTAHKAKGREWQRVKIADDFTPPKDLEETDAAGRPLPGPIADDEARLAYVAVTRARHCLDLGGLSWINQHPDGCSG
ncbi:UvrD-helicase domain-containing protein [Streptomyces sp. NPDC051569]|uniref:UvrD-helicase domain-containing protein n=1 Tax=Streptomyces sp. NPDC051569 TaxID=3365661 RepID=UPI0037B9EB2E